MCLAVRKWNNLLVKISRQCRTKVLLKDVEKYWGKKEKMTKKRFLEKQFSEIYNIPRRRRKRVAFIVGVLGFLAVTAIFSGISYLIAKAVVAAEMDDLEMTFANTTDILKDQINKTEEYVKEVGAKVARLEVRLSDMERYSQLNDYGTQSSQEAVDLTEFVLSKV